MKKYTVHMLLLIALPLVLANKECKRETFFEHPKMPENTQCKDCHEDGRSKDVRPAGHGIEWEMQHGSIIRKYGFKMEGTCVLCHSESACSSCHQQQKPRDHNLYWRIKGHRLSVGLNRSRCVTCHTVDFCERCHSQTKPVDHNIAFGAPSNRHCLTCHYPLNSAGAQGCAVCHKATPSHAGTPRQPANSIHQIGANCRDCHRPLRHADNAMACQSCHPR